MPVIVDPITQNVNVYVNPAQSVEVLQGSMGPEGISIVLSKVITASPYLLQITDKGMVLEGNSASAQTFTVPENIFQPFPIGSVVEVFQLGAGQITFVPQSGAVTLLSDGGRLKTAGQYATAGLRQRTLNQWVVSGDLTT